MFGYILWSDPTIIQAIIWSEDQGDLVFYRGDTAGSNTLKKGDCVTFELKICNGRRYAYNVLKAEQIVRVDLAENLQYYTQALSEKNAAPDDCRSTAQILDFLDLTRKMEPALKTQDSPHQCSSC